MSFRSFGDRAKEDRDYTRVRLKIDGGYDKHGDVFVIARPLTGSVSFPVKTFDDAKAREQFIEEFTFFRYGGQCPSWDSVLFANDCFSDEEKYSDTPKGKSYTSERGKAYVLQLIASGELVVHRTGSWIPPKDRNHHLPWPSAKEEFVQIKHQPYTLGPHEEPGYVPPVETSTMLGKVDEVDVPDTSRYDNALFSSEIRQTQSASKELFDAVSSRRDVHIAKPGSDDLKFLEMVRADASAGGPGNLSIIVKENPQKLTLMEEFLHGTQSKMWGDPSLEVTNTVRNFREWHVRDFMNRHQQMFGWDANELSVLRTELEYYRKLVNKGGQ